MKRIRHFETLRKQVTRPKDIDLRKHEKHDLKLEYTINSITTTICYSTSRGHGYTFY